jgi:DNA-binding CsgD family transcriptional regulator
MGKSISSLNFCLKKKDNQVVGTVNDTRKFCVLIDTKGDEFLMEGMHIVIRDAVFAIQNRTSINDGRVRGLKFLSSYTICGGKCQNKSTCSTIRLLDLSNKLSYSEMVRKISEAIYSVILFSRGKKLITERVFFNSLTQREQQVLLYMRAGLSQTDIATMLGISIRTVNAHKQNAMRRLNLTTNRQLQYWLLECLKNRS